MAKVYTIIDFFSVDDYGEPDQCWVANFSDKENAIAAFESKLRETEVLDADGKVLVDLNKKENENAILAFESKLRETEVLDADGKVLVDLDKDVRKNPRELFEEMLTGGFCYVSFNGSQTDKWFVRGEEIQTDFNAERISWE